MPTITTEALDTALHLSPAATTADSVIVMPASFDEAVRSFDTTLDTARLDALCAAVGPARADTVAAVAPPPAWTQGLEPAARLIRPGISTAFLAVIALLFVLSAFNFRTIRRLLGLYTDELVSVRKGRGNVFDDRPAGDTRVLILLIILAVISGGILLSVAVSAFGGHGIGPVMPLGVARVTGIVGLYYIFGLVACNVVGYIFATPEGRSGWIRGYNASQILPGIALALPAAIVIFYPDTARWVVAIGAIVYLLAKILFISKGFRIFYDKIGSLLYFILYLCTLEIIPLILVYNCSVFELV